ncbi:Type II secretory pathway, component PulJ [Anaerohalosphaera lusitana]|uniref:Type II secretory pathway, component PulJ n=1 Tax=Anaerohalosphaera lusitana TaxID=1936003 RepID=A0A1U9NLB7_9BACT|nr:prepilin-type N-terminal cleavage/methylation domain-containing protein [Anaerohalosphaera lusitana]AQT68528.1 Type II secretory pathway, component PulJ [Anaerohalosphaera lusitana]
MRKGFTIIELMLAMALLLALLVGSGVVFSEAIKAHRAAKATSEVSSKLRAITQQLEADFRGLQETGEVAVAWQAVPLDHDGDGTTDEYVRLDRIMFFADGDFATYGTWRTDTTSTDGQMLNGNLARVCYALASDPGGNSAIDLMPQNRILARSQHLYTAMTVYDKNDNPVDFPDPSGGTLQGATVPFSVPNSFFEFDALTMSGWLNLTFSATGASDKSDLLAQIFAIDLMGSSGDEGGLIVSPNSTVDLFGNATPDGAPVGLHQLLSQGVSEFRVQAWSEVAQGWYPQIDPSGEWDFGDDYSDRFVDAGGSPLDPTLGISSADSPVVLYQPGGTYFTVSGAGAADASTGTLALQEAPGLGRALKFTFTIHDENGFFENGKRFSYIVELN